MLLLYHYNDTIATITRQTKIGDSGAVVALVVERAAAGAAGVHATAYLPVVRYAVAGLTVRTEHLGVSSFVRALKLKKKLL